jgi:hypothetical protein
VFAAWYILPVYIKQIMFCLQGVEVFVVKSFEEKCDFLKAVL